MHFISETVTFKMLGKCLRIVRGFRNGRLFSKIRVSYCWWKCRLYFAQFLSCKILHGGGSRSTLWGTFRNEVELSITNKFKEQQRMYHIFDMVISSWNAVCYKARMEPMYCGAGGHDSPLFNPRPRGGCTSVYIVFSVPHLSPNSDKSAENEP